MNNKFWDHYAKHYDGLPGRLGNVYGEIKKKVLEYVDSSSVVLEAGTGTGEIAMVIAEKACRTEACDLSQAMINIAEKKRKQRGIKNIRFTVGDCCSMEFPDNSFDLVVISNVLHIIKEPQDAVFEIIRVLKPGGTVLAPTYLHGENLLSYAFSTLMTLRGFKVYSRWSRKSLIAFFMANGLEIVDLTVHRGSIPLALPVLRNRIISINDTHTEGNRDE